MHIFISQFAAHCLLYSRCLMYEEIKEQRNKNSVSYVLKKFIMKTSALLPDYLKPQQTKMNNYFTEKMGKMGNKRDEYKESNKHLFRGSLVSTAVAGNLHMSGSANPYNNTMSQIFIFFFYRQRNWGSEKLNNLFKVMQLVTELEFKPLTAKPIFFSFVQAGYHKQKQQSTAIINSLLATSISDILAPLTFSPLLPLTYFFFLIEN